MIPPAEGKKGEALIPNQFYGKGLLSAEQLTAKNRSWLSQFLPVMEAICSNSTPSNLLDGKIMFCVFSEAPIQTQVSYQAAMRRLGGDVSVIENPEKYSSLANGAKPEDEVDFYSQMGNIIVIHHPKEDFIQMAIKASRVPVINASFYIDEDPKKDVYYKMALIAATLVADLTPQEIINSTRDLQFNLPM